MGGPDPDPGAARGRLDPQRLRLPYPRHCGRMVVSKPQRRTKMFDFNNRKVQIVAGALLLALIVALAQCGVADIPLNQ